MDYDLVSKLGGVPAIAFASYDADQASAAFDHASYGLYKALAAEISIGAGGIVFTGTNKVEFKMTHSDNGVDYVAVDEEDVILPYGQSVGRGGIVKSLIVAHATADITFVGYRGKKQYVKIAADFGGTHADPTPMAVNWLLGFPMSAPTWNASVPDIAA